MTQKENLCHKLTLIAMLTILLPLSAIVSAQTDSAAINLSFLHLEAGRLDSAEFYLKRALASDPDSPLNPLLLNNLGSVQRSAGKTAEALESYNLALIQSPDNAVLIESRASLLTETGHAERAILDYSALLNLQPTSQEALYQRGLLYLQTGNDALAEADFEKMLGLNPDGVYPRLGYAALAKFRNQLDEAEKIYSFLIDKQPTDPQFYAGRAEVFLLAGKGGKASADATHAIRLAATDNPWYYMLRYRAKLMLHEEKSAAADLKKAVELGYESADNYKIIINK
jgi:tetratricopeptide (TPR) repeat protein